jgi:hypothetical protein
MPVPMERVERLNLAISAGAAAAGYALVSPAFAAGVAAGAAIEAVSFRHLLRSGRRLFEGRSLGWGAGFGLRFGLLGIGIGTALWAGAHPIGLVIGLSLILPLVVFEAWRTRPPIDPEAKALPADDPAWERWDPWLAREREDDEGDAA